MPLREERTKLGLGGRWSLEELSDTTKDYVQLYGFAYSLMPDLPLARRADRITTASLPWSVTRWGPCSRASRTTRLK